MDNLYRELFTNYDEFIRIMKKAIFWPILVLVFGLILIGSQAQASEMADFTVHEIENYNIYPATFDQLVLDVTIPNEKESGDDILEAITVRNLGTAKFVQEILVVKIWADSAAEGFQGMARDIELGEAEYHTGCSCWGLGDLSQTVPQEGLRIFASIETRKPITTTRSARFEISPLIDEYEEGEYDPGDSGVFMTSKNNGPEDGGIGNTLAMLVKESVIDLYAPHVVITDPLDGAVITTESYTIKGQARDQGGSAPAMVEVNINDELFETESIGDNFSTWEYDLTNLADGTYTLETRSRDFKGIEDDGSETITVTVKLPASEPEEEPVDDSGSDEEDESPSTSSGSSIDVSSAYSTFEVNFYSQKADGLSAIRATIYIKDENEQPLSGVEVSLSASRGLKDTISTSSNISDANGKVQFDIKSNTKGNLILSADVGGVGIGSPQEIVFVNPLVYPTKTLVKQIDKPAVYLFEKAKLRAFPSAEVFLSAGHQWSDIEKIGDLSDFLIGDDVKYPDGYLVKGTSDKVYLITNGQRRWISTGEVFVGLGYQWGDIRIITDTLLSEYELGVSIDTFDKRPDGTLIKYSGSDKVYVIVDGKKKWIESVEEFVNGGYRWEDIKTVEDSEIYEDY